jgi:hypothetical protein
VTEQEMQDMIDRVADRFEQASNTTVTPLARKALLIPALPHMEEVSRDLQTKKISVQFLESSLQRVLENALTVMRERDVRSIDDHSVQQSIARNCPYLFWC